MGMNDFMAKVRYWDNIAAKWMMRHFYIFFFEVILVVIFFGLFINILKVIDINHDINPSSTIERLLLNQSYSILIIVFLMLLNSFWMLFMFNSIMRFRTLLKEINFNLSKRKNHPSS